MGVFNGGAREVAKLFLVIHLLMTVAFVVAGRQHASPTKLGQALAW
jgi:hypothetical protein